MGEPDHAGGQQVLPNGGHLRPTTHGHITLWVAGTTNKNQDTPRIRQPAPCSGSRQILVATDTTKVCTSTARLTTMSDPSGASTENPSELITQRIESLADWRGPVLGRLRELIHQAEPEVVEEWKWRGTPVWAKNGLICTGESYKQVVKLTFAKGASLADPAHLFNSSLDGNVRRAIDIHQGEKIDERAFKALIRSAVAFNLASKRK